MSTRKPTLFIGYGALASRCGAHLIKTGHSVVGIARGARQVEGLEFWQGDISDSQMRDRIAAREWAAAVITLTPSRYDESGYRAAYLEPVQHLSTLWRAQGIGRLLFVSSTSVYGQGNGEWVDHASETLPHRATARVLLEAERAALAVKGGCVVRLSGIYGPNRDYLIRQVLAGKGGDETFTNRIHEDDAVAAILHLLSLSADALAPVYLASDEMPVTSGEIRRWLARELGRDANSLASPESPSRAGNKRCDSRLLRASGFQFRYPDYRSGYRAVLSVREPLSSD